MTRARRWVLAAAALVLLAALLSYWGSRPQRVAALVTSQLGSVLGLEITAKGASEYTLAGGPRLVLRDVRARQPGALRNVLRAERIEVAVPWSTVRSRGAELTITRIELDKPVLDVVALQTWLASRPEDEQRTPTLTDGLVVNQGRVIGDGWSIISIMLDVPRVVPGQRVDARLAGYGIVGEARFPVTLTATLTQPANDAGFAVQGTIGYAQDATRVSAQMQASGPLHVGDDGLRIAPLRLSADVRYTVNNTPTDVRFAFGLNGPLRIRDATVALSPAGVALRGSGLVPDVDARAAFAWSKQAALHLDGRLARWPEEWPALPPPIGQSESPLPFVLDYAGSLDFAGIARLQASRDDTRFDGRFRLPEVLAWVDATDASPLPPLSGTVHAPRVDIAGAVLEGVDVRMTDPTLDAAP